MPTLSSDQENLLSEARAKGRQDKHVPLLVHVEDGRLMPNVPQLRRNMKYRPYTGNPKASLDERLAYAKSITTGARGRRMVVDTVEDQPPFELAKASKAELIKFADDEFNTSLDPSMTLSMMRSTIKELDAARSLAPQGAAAEDSLS